MEIVRTKKEVNYGINELGVQDSAILEFKVSQFFMDKGSNTIQVMVVIATEQGQFVRATKVPFKLDNFINMFGENKLSFFFSNLEQMLIDTIDAMNNQLIAEGQTDKLFFFGLLKKDMKLVKI